MFGPWDDNMPKAFNKLTAVAAPIMRSNIDTDVIIRIERLVGNSVRGTLGKWAFGSLRYLPDGSENPDFIVNKAIVDGLAAEIAATQGAGRISIDLEAQTVTSPSGQQHRFEIDPRRR